MSVEYASTPTAYSIQRFTVSINPSGNVNTVTVWPSIAVVNSGTWSHEFIHLGSGVYEKQSVDNTDMPQPSIFTLFAPMQIELDLNFTLVSGGNCQNSLALKPTSVTKVDIMAGTASFPWRINTTSTGDSEFQSNYFVGAALEQVGVVYEQAALHQGNNSGEYRFDSTTGTFTLGFTPGTGERLIFERLN